MSIVSLVFLIFAIFWDYFTKYTKFPSVMPEKSVGTTELNYSTKKRKHSFSILKAFFVRHSSEYETSDNDRKVNRNISRAPASGYIFRFTFRSLSDVSYSDECRTKKAFSMLKECFRFSVLQLCLLTEHDEHD